ncbi:hypothetical protein [Cohnella faecalis]|uniref:Uncharacterized protein n=1 Tax=Cohnella faecalis TaxID=2315694 RepID=A0A398CNS6_9BACL|nr:hypothetical protein [Cohnella faecalis]RIE04145.1 hypothetical protein D3H35_07805 [Cohnella faecalis]
MENKSHKGNYKGTTNMAAKNQDMAFVNDTLENTKSVAPTPAPTKKRTNLSVPGSSGAASSD